MPKIAISAKHGCRHFVFLRSRDVTSQSRVFSLHVPCVHLVLHAYCRCRIERVFTRLRVKSQYHFKSTQNSTYLTFMNKLKYTAQTLLRITFSTVCYFCVFVINQRIDFKELKIICASCTWQINNLSTQLWGPRTGVSLAIGMKYAMSKSWSLANFE